MSTQNNVETCIRLNSDGIQLFRQGQYGPASMNFAKASQILGMFLLEKEHQRASSSHQEQPCCPLPNDQDFDDDDDVDCNDMDRCCIAHCEPMIIDNSNNNNNNNDGDENDKKQEYSCGSVEPQSTQYHQSQQQVFADFIYRKPMAIRKNTPLVHRDREFQLSLCVACFYNCALANHWKSLVSSNNSNNGDYERGSNHLLAAMRFYELAYSLQAEEDLEIPIDFTLGIVNNLGQIHQGLGDKPKAEQCFQHLLSTMMYLVESGHREDIQDCDDEVGFFQTISHLIMKQSVAPAA